MCHHQTRAKFGRISSSEPPDFRFRGRSGWARSRWLHTLTPPIAKRPLRGGRVKRPMNSFLVWAQIQRRNLSSSFPDIPNIEKSRELGRIWKRLTELEKKTVCGRGETTPSEWSTRTTNSSRGRFQQLRAQRARRSGLEVKYIRLLKSQVTYRTCLQSKYRLYEIRPTSPARRLATR